MVLARAAYDSDVFFVNPRALGAICFVTRGKGARRDRVCAEYSPETRQTMKPALHMASVLVAATLFAGTAHAADELAETLFRAGKQAATAGDFKTACQKFEASQRLEPAPGTLLNLGDCEEKLGHFTRASQYFQSAISLYRAGDARIAYAKQRAGAAEARTARVVLVATNAAPRTKVSWDGTELDPSTLGQPFRADPGDHVVVVRVPGKPDSQIALTLSAGETKQISLPSSAAPVAEVVAPAPAAAPPRSEERRPPILAMKPAQTERSAPNLRTAGFVGLGVGAAGIGVGLVAGLFTLNAKSDADEHCPAQGCDSDGLSAQSRGKTWSTVSTVGFIAGGVGLAAGASLLLFRPARSSATAVTARPTLGGAELQWVGHF